MCVHQLLCKVLSTHSHSIATNTQTSNVRPIALSSAHAERDGASNLQRSNLQKFRRTACICAAAYICVFVHWHRLYVIFSHHVLHAREYAHNAHACHMYVYSLPAISSILPVNWINAGVSPHKPTLSARLQLQSPTNVTPLLSGKYDICMYVYACIFLNQCVCMWVLMIDKCKYQRTTNQIKPAIFKSVKAQTNKNIHIYIHI